MAGGAFVRFDDFGKFFEEAFDAIEPKDDAHREKLAKARENIRKLSEESARDLRKAHEDIERLNDSSSFDEAKRINDEHARINTELREAMTSSFREQTSLIERIAGATRAL
jgi:hypothetical protein